MDFEISEFDAVFFDLDGTLLGLSDDAFEGTYTKLIAKRFIDKLEPERFVNALWEGTEAMMKHHNPDIHVLDAFFNRFGELTGISRDETYQRFDEFYQNEFGKLESVCDPVPEARKLVDELTEMGKKVVLATNPVFPEIATRRRCDWTNLDFDEFTHVSHAENSYACKPNPAYYLRLLEIAGVKPERTLMVGNDYLFDMAAAEVGMKTWLIDKYLGNDEHKDKFRIDYRGSLNELLTQIKT